MVLRREEAVSTCYSKGERCQSRTVGFSWKQKTPGVYERFMIVKCAVCGDRNARIVHYLDLSLPFCTACGSQNFTGPPTEDNLILTCADCGRQQSICIGEPQDGCI